MCRKKSGKMKQVNLDIFNTARAPRPHTDTRIVNDGPSPRVIEVDTPADTTIKTPSPEYTDIQTRPSYINAELAYQGIKKVELFRRMTSKNKTCARCSGCSSIRLARTSTHQPAQPTWWPVTVYHEYNTQGNPKFNKLCM